RETVRDEFGRRFPVYQKSCKACVRTSHFVHNSAQWVLIHPLSINAGAPGCLTVGRMLAAKAQYSLGNARKYFEEHLRVGLAPASNQTVNDCIPVSNKSFLPFAADLFRPMIKPI